MEVQETKKSIRRRYMTVGIIMGLAITVVSTRMFESSDKASTFLLGVVLAAIGGLLGTLFAILGDSADSVDDAPGPVAAMPDVKPARMSTSSTIRIVAVSPETSTADLRPMRISAQSRHASAPDVDLNVLIEEYDYAVRVPVLDGVLEKLSARDLSARANKEVALHCPKTARNPTFELVAMRSEAQILDDGRCPDGWSFYYVDGRLGLGCLATATRHEFSLQYHTTPTHFRPEPGDWPEAARIRAILAEHLPESIAWRVHIGFPSDILAHTLNGRVVADVDVDAGAVRNLTHVRALLETSRPELEAFDLANVMMFLRGESPDEPEASDEPLTSDEPQRAFWEAIQDSDFQANLRTLDAGALTRVAAALYRFHGVSLMTLMEDGIIATPHVEQQIGLLTLLAYVPSGLAVVTLHRLAKSGAELETKADAESLFLARIRHKIVVPSDPFEQMDFVDMRVRMGKPQLVSIPLRPTYDPESDLLGPLKAAGLNVTRSRYLSGTTDLLLAVYMRPSRGDAEGLLTSTPVPVPCHILRLVGSNVAVFKQRLEKQGVVLPEDEIYADAASGNPVRVHHAALYLAALELESPSGSGPLLEGMRRSKKDKNLRRAVLRAMEFINDEQALNTLSEAAADPDDPDNELALGIMERRTTRVSRPSLEISAAVSGEYDSITSDDAPSGPTAAPA